MHIKDRSFSGRMCRTCTTSIGIDRQGLLFRQEDISPRAKIQTTAENN